MKTQFEETLYDYVELTVIGVLIAISFGQMIVGIFSPLYHWLFDVAYTIENRVADIHHLLIGIVMYAVILVKLHSKKIQ